MNLQTKRRPVESTWQLCSAHGQSLKSAADMNRFSVLLLCFLARARCQTGSEIDSDVGPALRKDSNNNLASVREYPSLLHKCTATFITNEILMTTAKCLFCEDCELFVHALSDRLTDENKSWKGVSVNVSKVAIHPDYERVPHQNDIGLIKLKSRIKDAIVFGLPKDFPLVKGLLTTYRWQFTQDLTDYYLEKLTVKTMSTALCSLILNRYINEKLLCTRRHKSLSLGSFDEGMPLVGTEGDQKVVMGIYVREGVVGTPRADVYQAVLPYVHWIEEVKKCDFTCALLQPEPKNVTNVATTIKPLYTNGVAVSESVNNISAETIVTTIKTVNDNEPNPITPPEHKQLPKQDIAETLRLDGSESQRKAVPDRWTADFPFSEQKKAPFVPKVKVREELRQIIKQRERRLQGVKYKRVPNQLTGKVAAANSV